MGFGRLAERYYVPALAALRRVKIVAVAEPLSERQKAAQAAFPGTRLYGQLSALFAAEKVDALLVAAPPSEHLLAMQAAIRHRIPIFLEKPFLLPGELATLSGETPTAPMMINFNRRFWYPYEKFRRQLHARKGRDPLRLRAVIHVNLLRWNAITDHRVQLKAGGLLQDLGSQALDLTTFLLKQEPLSVRTRFRHGSGHDAKATLKLAFPDQSSAICSIAYSRHALESVRARVAGHSFALLHPMGGLRKGGHGFFSAADFCRDLFSLAGHSVSFRFSMIGSTVHSALKHFFACIRTGTEPQPGWNAAIQNARVLEAAWLSYRENRRVGLAEIALP